jgi:transcriptional regulator with XRE-family HTH domain
LIYTDELNENYVKDIYINIGKNVKKFRKEKKLSQLDLSYLMGYKSVTIISCCEICHKNYHFNIEHIAKIAKILDINICEFFKES